jgi:dihydroxy-acid dehydratase
MNLLISDKEFESRIKKLKPFQSKVKRGWLARYSEMVTSADTGAVFKI